MRERESVVVARATHDRHVYARAHARDSYKNAMRAKNLTKVRGICHDALEADRDWRHPDRPKEQQHQVVARRQVRAPVSAVERRG